MNLRCGGDGDKQTNRQQKAVPRDAVGCATLARHLIMLSSYAYKCIVLYRAGMLKHKQWTLKHAKYWFIETYKICTLVVKACILQRTLKHAKLVYHLE